MWSSSLNGDVLHGIAFNFGLLVIEVWDLAYLTVEKLIYGVIWVE